MNYAWSTEIDSCTYSDGFKSVKECVQDAKNSGCKPYTVIYVGEAKRQEIRGIYFDEVLENVHDQMYSDVGDAAYAWDIEDPDQDKEKFEEYQEKLKQLVLNYLKEIGMEPKFFEVVNVRAVVID